MKIEEFKDAGNESRSYRYNEIFLFLKPCGSVSSLYFAQELRSRRPCMRRREEDVAKDNWPAVLHDAVAECAGKSSLAAPLFISTSS
ncbi:hypothetical protein SLA2020_517730 [Shorea laevis]